MHYDAIADASCIDGRCALCKTTEGELRRCKRCKQVKYCKEHQHEDWPRHKAECKNE